MRTIFCVFTILIAAAFAQAQTTGTPKLKEESEVPRITLADAKLAFDNNTAVFVDARAPETYKEEHIKGAINIWLGKPDLDAVPKGKTIIVYCS